MIIPLESMSVSYDVNKFSPTTILIYKCKDVDVIIMDKKYSTWGRYVACNQIFVIL